MRGLERARDLFFRWNQKDRHTAGPPIGSAEFQARMDQKTGTTLSSATSIQVHAGGEAELRALIGGIRSAPFAILDVLSFAADDVGWQVADALIAAAKEGKYVRLMVDSHYIGAIKKKDPKTTRDGRTLYDALVDAGVTVGESNKVGLTHNPMERAHDKLYILGDKLLFGGFNPTHHNFVWNDYLHEITGPAVGVALAEAQADFQRCAHVQRGSTPEPDYAKHLSVTPGGIPVRVVTTNPALKMDGNRIRDAYLELIRSARTSITIENAYLTDPLIMQALADADQRGVRVRALFSAKNEHPIAALSAEAFYEQLIKAGVEIYEIKGMTHAKAMEVDGEVVVNGSANLMPLLYKTQDEVALIVHDRDAAQAMRTTFDKAMEGAVRVTADNVLKHAAPLPASVVVAAFEKMGAGVFGIEHLLGEVAQAAREGGETHRRELLRQFQSWIIDPNLTADRLKAELQRLRERLGTLSVP